MNVLNLTGSFNVPTPPVPGASTPAPAPATNPNDSMQWGIVPATPQPVVPRPQVAAPTLPQPTVPGAPAPTVSQYWAVGGQSYHTLAEAGQAIANGAPAPPDGRVNAQKLVYADTATQQAAHMAKAKHFLKNSLVVGIGGSLLGAIFPPLALVGGLLSTYNGWQAFTEWQASQQDAQPQYMVAEEGRVKAAPGVQPFPFTYEAVNEEHFGNVVPNYPLFYKPPVPLGQLTT